MSEADITIRPIEAADAAAVNRIMWGLDWFSWPEPAAESEARFAAQIERYFAGGSENRVTLMAVTADGSAAGFVCAHWLYSVTATEGYISHLFVDEAYRGQGIGRRLLAAITEQAQASGCFRLFLYARRHREVYRRLFYPNHGWQEQDDAALFMQFMQTDE